MLPRPHFIESSDLLFSHCRYLIVTGFSRQSERQVMVYRTEDLTLLNSVTLDVSPAILLPHYDADSNTLFLTGKV